MPVSNSQPVLLSVDAGTSGLRAVAFDEAGVCRAQAEAAYAQRHVAVLGVEQDAATWIGALERTLSAVAPAAAGAPAALAVTSQRATIVPVDADGRALHPALSWRDKRSGPQCRWLAAQIGAEELYARTGLRLDPYFSLPKILWLRDERPRAFARARSLLTIHDLLVHHLTGRSATEYTQASRTLLFDVDRLRWDVEIAAACGLDPGLLPEALPPGSVAGGLRREVARRVGLPAGLPVVMAGGDQQSAAVGLGVVGPGLAEVTTGSGAFVLAPVARPRRDAGRQVLCSAAAVPGTWILEGSVLTAMSAYRWLREELTGGVREPCDVEAVLADSPPGARGVVALPYLSGSGAPHWDPAARGVLFNLGLRHVAADLGRAVLEGIVIEVAAGLRAIRELCEEPIGEVRAGGSATASDRFNQLQADVFGLPVMPGAGKHSTALGAAIQAAAAIGLRQDVPAAANAMVGAAGARRRTPDPARTALYDRLRALRERLYATLDAAELYAAAATMQDEPVSGDELIDDKEAGRP